jgi:hypothetical protein
MMENQPKKWEVIFIPGFMIGTFSQLLIDLMMTTWGQLNLDQYLALKLFVQIWFVMVGMFTFFAWRKNK